MVAVWVVMNSGLNDRFAGSGQDYPELGQTQRPSMGRLPTVLLFYCIAQAAAILDELRSAGH
ncbi:hypothetical protein GCM10027081_52660 [Cupriavidus yeoncheonensis]